MNKTVISYVLHAAAGIVVAWLPLVMSGIPASWLSLTIGGILMMVLKAAHDYAGL